MTVIVEVTIIPLGVGVSLSSYVSEAIRALKERGIPYKICPTATIFETNSLEEAFELVRQMVERVFSAGVPRVVLTVKADERRDIGSPRMEAKISSVEEKLERKGK